MCAASNNHSPNKCKILLHFGRATANVGRSSAPVPMDGSAVRERKIERERLIVTKGKRMLLTQHSQLMLLDEGGPEVGVVGAFVAFPELRVRLISAVLLRPAKRVERGKACKKLVIRAEQRR